MQTFEARSAYVASDDGKVCAVVQGGTLRLLPFDKGTNILRCNEACAHDKRLSFTRPIIGAPTAIKDYETGR